MPVVDCRSEVLFPRSEFFKVRHYRGVGRRCVRGLRGNRPAEQSRSEPGTATPLRRAGTTVFDAFVGGSAVFTAFVAPRRLPRPPPAERVADCEVTRLNVEARERRLARTGPANGGRRMRTPVNGSGPQSSTGRTGSRRERVQGETCKIAGDVLANILGAICGIAASAHGDRPDSAPS